MAEVLLLENLTPIGSTNYYIIEEKAIQEAKEIIKKYLKRQKA